MVAGGDVPIGASAIPGGTGVPFFNGGMTFDGTYEITIVTPGVYYITFGASSENGVEVTGIEPAAIQLFVGATGQNSAMITCGDLDDPTVGVSDSMISISTILTLAASDTLTLHNVTRTAEGGALVDILLDTDTPSRYRTASSFDIFDNFPNFSIKI